MMDLLLVSIAMNSVVQGDGREMMDLLLVSIAMNSVVQGDDTSRAMLPINIKCCG